MKRGVTYRKISPIEANNVFKKKLSVNLRFTYDITFDISLNGLNRSQQPPETNFFIYVKFDFETGADFNIINLIMTNSTSILRKIYETNNESPLIADDDLCNGIYSRSDILGMTFHFKTKKANVLRFYQAIEMVQTKIMEITSIIDKAIDYALVNEGYEKVEYPELP